MYFKLMVGLHSVEINGFILAFTHVLIADRVAWRLYDALCGHDL